MKKNKASLKYQCKIFDVWEEEVDLPNGKSNKQSWINHNPTVAIVAINDKNEILLQNIFPVMYFPCQHLF